MTYLKYNIADLTGGPTPVLTLLLQDKTITGRTDPTIAGITASNIAKKLATEYLYATMLEAITDMYDMYVLTHGEFADCEPDKRDDWEGGLDDETEKVVAPYERMLTANWLGTNTIDTRFHRNEKEGPKAELEGFANSFAEEIWKVLIHYTHKDESTGETELRTKSTWQILSSVGIMRDDIAALLADMPDAAPEETQQPPKELKPMPELYEVMNKLHEHCGGVFDRAEYMGFMELAVDDDDGLAASGIQPMGGDLDDCDPLRMFAMTEDAGTVAAKLCDMLAGAPYGSNSEALAHGSASAPPVPGTDEDDMSEFTAQPDPLDIPPALDRRNKPPVPPVPSAAPVAPPVPPVAPKVPAMTTGAPPPPAKGGKKKGGVEIPGALDPRVFALARTHLKIKDDELGAGCGISRQTLINYSKPNAKATFVPTPEAKQYLREQFVAAQTGIAEALQLLDLNDA